MHLQTWCAINFEWFVMEEVYHNRARTRFVGTSVLTYPDKDDVCLVFWEGLNLDTILLIHGG